MATPNAKAATPRWAANMPHRASGIWPARWPTCLKLPPAGSSRAFRSTPSVATIQKAISRPPVVIRLMRPAQAPTPKAATSAMTSAGLKRLSSGPISSCFQRVSGPMPITSTSGAINSANTESK